MTLDVHLASEFGAAAAAIELHLKVPLRVQIVIQILMAEMVKGPEHLVYVPDRLVRNLGLNILVVG